MPRHPFGALAPQSVASVLQACKVRCSEIGSWRKTCPLRCFQSCQQQRRMKAPNCSAGTLLGLPSWSKLSTCVPSPRRNPSACQKLQACGHLKIKWSTVSSAPPQTSHVESSSTFFFFKLHLCWILSLVSSQAKNWTRGGAQLSQIKREMASLELLTDVRSLYKVAV